MKCPSCAATVGALDRVCQYCGAEIPAEVLPSVAASSIESVATGPTAASLSDQIQEDLAALALQPPATRVAAILVGLLTPPTLGLAFLAHKALQVFGKQGESANRLILSIDEGIRKGKTAYKHDPDIMASFMKYETELAGYHAKRHSTRLDFLASCGASVALIVVVLLVTGFMAKKEIDRKGDNLKATLVKVQMGDLPGALAIMTNLKQEERVELASRDEFARIPLAILNGQDGQAMELAKGIADTEARTKAVNFIGQRMVDTLVKVPDYKGALNAAAVLTPESSRIQAEDSVRVLQAKGFIESNKMDEAKKVIANIHDEGAKGQLTNMIKAKLPKAELKGF